MLIKACATLQRDVNSLQSNFVFPPRSRGHLGLNFCQGNISTIQSFALQSMELFSVMWMTPSALVRDVESWWRSTLPWPAVSSVYEECHHGWQPSRSMIYTLPIATGTCREVTTRLRRSVGLFRARGVLDANRRNDTVWCLKFNSWNTVQTFAADLSITWWRSCLITTPSTHPRTTHFTPLHSTHFLLLLQCHLSHL